MDSYRSSPTSPAGAAVGPEQSGAITADQPEARAGAQIPVLHPLLPDAHALLPYLQRIDQSRTYTNWGPLTVELESRLAGRWSLPESGVVSAGSGTAALVGAILATAGRATAGRPVAIVPALTFVATAVAVELCGYEVKVVDVDPETWMLDPARLAAGQLSDVGLVVPVAPFGAGVPQQSWAEFREREDRAVVIDGAASFESIERDAASYLGSIPVALSFHATKPFAAGEGGCVACTDARLAQEIVRALNFGFYDTRESMSPSLNGKMSEYHAAVALASLDVWESTRTAFLDVAAAYREEFSRVGLADRLGTAPEIASCYVIFRAADPGQASRIRARLGRRGIDTRVWYGGGVHRHPHFAGSAHGALTVTDAIAPCLIGLPVAPDLAGGVARSVAETVAAEVGVQ